MPRPQELFEWAQRTISTQGVKSVDTSNPVLRQKRKRMGMRAIDHALDIASIMKRSDGSGHLGEWLTGRAWDDFTPIVQGKLCADIRRFRKELRRGGYPVD